MPKQTKDLEALAGQLPWLSKEQKHELASQPAQVRNACGPFRHGGNCVHCTHHLARDSHTPHHPPACWLQDPCVRL